MDNQLPNVTFTRQTCFDSVKDKVKFRVVLYFLVITGFTIVFMNAMCTNLIMVSMVKFSSTKEDISSNITLVNSSEYCPDKKYQLTNEEKKLLIKQGEYDWDISIQSNIIGSFFWCYTLSQLPGGVLTQKFGSKVVFGWSMLVISFCSLLIPYATDVHYNSLIALRGIQGIAVGFTWPSMYAIVGPWIPLAERSRFMSSFQGLNLGIGLSFPLAGYLVTNYGWRSVYYTTGSMGVGWLVFWLILAYDTPEEHPLINLQERVYIQSAIKNVMARMPVPWKKILMSSPVWAVAITTFGRVWIQYTFVNSGPRFMKNVLGFNIQENGIFSGAPFLLGYFSSLFFCFVADMLVTRKFLSLTITRKLFTILSQIVPGILLFVIGQLGCDTISIVVCWCISIILISATFVGAMANIVDIAPNCAAQTSAWAQTIGLTASFLSQWAAEKLTPGVRNLNEWTNVFNVGSVVAILTCLIHIIFGTSEIQKWNLPSESSEKEDGATVIDTNELQLTVPTQRF